MPNHIEPNPGYTNSNFHDWKNDIKDMAKRTSGQAVQFFSCENKVTSLLKKKPESLKSEDLLVKVPDGPPLVEDEGSGAGPDFYYK
eukprot:CAMPEP_0206386298 /NCGR_PEP_ID=MMETSP0294-20121207/15842_1 /ASSEMBLY_ACC=CAM_ASM_000327 /TAXON_ID=39354 /ORGANISM="Heterosigma akashiwo, Strain CCMP2393" /LENGTH=85 /DNA_ID=CAMNT_0053837283 /DNA_START=376 /DNA_END=630 /DNA_ORIENTATION=+